MSVSRLSERDEERQLEEETESVGETKAEVSISHCYKL